MANPVQDHVKEIVRLIEKQSYTHDRYRLFSDSVATAALAISNSVDLGHRDKREARYMQIVGHYDQETIETFPKIMGHVAMGLEGIPQDVLGSAFHQLELHNSDRGQFFTPYELCKMMAHMQIDDSPAGQGERAGLRHRS